MLHVNFLQHLDISIDNDTRGMPPKDHVNILVVHESSAKILNDYLNSF